MKHFELISETDTEEKTYFLGRFAGVENWTPEEKDVLSKWVMSGEGCPKCEDDSGDGGDFDYHPEDMTFVCRNCGFTVTRKEFLSPA